LVTLFVLTRRLVRQFVLQPERSSYAYYGRMTPEAQMDRTVNKGDEASHESCNILCSASLLPLSKRPMPCQRFHHKSRYGCAQCKAKKIEVRIPNTLLFICERSGQLALLAHGLPSDLLSSAMLRDPVHDVSRSGFNESFRRL
jgi:hypothetical protein